jgi:transposase
VLHVEDWAEVRRLRRAEQIPIARIARVMGISRNTVKAALASSGPPKYERAAKGSVADGFEPRIRELLRVFPAMPATVIAERIGWPYSIRTLSGKVAELRPAYLPPDPVWRTAYAAGEIAQCDFWFPDITLPCGFGQVRTAKQLPVLTMVTGYARWASGSARPGRETGETGRHGMRQPGRDRRCRPRPLGAWPRGPIPQVHALCPFARDQPEIWRAEV